MRKLVAIWLMVLTGAMTLSCAQDSCPGYGNGSSAPLSRIAARSGRIKPKESMIHPHRPKGRKPPKRIY